MKVGEPVILEIASSDVDHGFNIPALNIRADLLPGQIARLRANLTFAGSSAGEGNGNVTYGEAFTVQSLGNSLVTGQQIYDLLEQHRQTGSFPTAHRWTNPLTTA